MDRDDDPIVVLRRRQLAEYRKLCSELRLHPNSGCVQAFSTQGTVDATTDGDDEAAAPSPHEYDFSRLYLGDKQMLPLAGALAVDRQLVSVMLPDAGIKDRGMVQICEQLKRSPKLEYLDVSRNRFSLGGAQACLMLAKSAPKLVLVRSDDTCLDEAFCFKRGLGAEYTSVRESLLGLCEGRALQDSTESLPPAPASALQAPPSQSTFAG